ncbi:MAG: allantoate amidohydrolase [Gammaproteobacteria bacterium]
MRSDTLLLGEQIMAHIDALAECSESPDLLTRSYLTAEHRRANERVMQWMNAAGMASRIDAVGNVVGRYEGRAPGLPAVVLGSHLDTVPDGGKFDGMLGVVTPIACVAALHQRRERLPFAIEVIGFGDEEGTRFQSALFGSRAVAGTIDKAALKEADADGVTLEEALHAFGLNPGEIDEAQRTSHEFLAYVELHIEQGPILESEGLPVGVVTAISGQTRLAVTIDGKAGHAGTVPMNLRADALTAAAEIVLKVEAICRETPGAVGTVGRLEALPGAANVIPGHVGLTIDMRAPTDDLRNAIVEIIQSHARAVGRQRGLGVHIENYHSSATCACSPAVMEQLETSVEAMGIASRCLPSGAGHDASAIADLTDVGMLFVRCREGISHHPDESITVEDAETAAQVMLHFLRNFDPGGKP